MQLSPTEKYLFLFCNRHRNKLKALYWNRTGFCLWYMRLEQDKFNWPRKFIEQNIQISTEQLTWLLEGYNIWKMRPHQSLSLNLVI
jgi:transposase